MSLQEVRNSILALRPSDWLKVADWIALTSFLTLFASSGSAGRLGEASFFLAMALSTSAHAVCTTIHRRYLALHGRLPDPPLSRIGAATEILTYRASLQAPLIDLLLYLALFFLGFAATVFWFLSPLVLAPLYATTVIVDSRIVRTVAQTPGQSSNGKVLDGLDYPPTSELPTACHWKHIPGGSAFLRRGFRNVYDLAAWLSRFAAPSPRTRERP